MVLGLSLSASFLPFRASYPIHTECSQINEDANWENSFDFQRYIETGMYRLVQVGNELSHGCSCLSNEPVCAAH